MDKDIYIRKPRQWIQNKETENHHLLNVKNNKKH